MKGSTNFIDFKHTNYFSEIIIDYLNKTNALHSFTDFSNDFDGIKKAIESRKNFPVDRKSLVESLQNQYKNINLSKASDTNLKALLNKNTFTIVTAHQPNILTGHLYFIYKILHAIKLCEYCKHHLPQYNFVPIFFMGSEDADLDELNNVFVDQKKYTWQTPQKGAVGRMKIDKNFMELIHEMESQVAVLPYGNEIMELVKKHYVIDNIIDTATSSFVNALFGKYGLLIIIPDDSSLKSLTASIFKTELLTSPSISLVESKNKLLSEVGYKTQAHARNINLFYLKDDIRNRIEREGDIWKVVDTDFQFSQKEIEAELKNYPERFSPNVILRGVFQEAVLPNIAFIGGGGELAYWLQLKSVFEYFNVFYPVLIVRNSFLLIDQKTAVSIDNIGLHTNDLFKPIPILQAEQIKKHTQNNLSLQDAVTELELLYEQVKKQAEIIDASLIEHISRLSNQSIQKIHKVEKKMLKSEKRNQQDRVNQINKIKSRLFPMNNLQERIENIIPFWARYGSEIIDILYENSLPIEQKFGVISLSNQTDL